MSTKAQQVLDLFSPWNQAANDEPVLIVRASEWREVLYMALRIKQGTELARSLYEQSVQMKSYSDENDIPF